MTSPTTTALVAAVLFVATLVRSTFGFGEALVAVPLLALVLPVTVAAPLAVLASILVAAWIVVRDHRHVELASAARLGVFALPGIPLGLWVLAHAPETWVKLGLAVLIASFAAYSLRSSRTALLADDRWAWLFGFVSGVLGGAYGMNGPPLALYGAMRGWSAERFRATLQGYFLLASAIGMIGYAVAGLVDRELARLFAWSLPGIAIAVPVGRVLNRRLGAAASFRASVYVLLLVVAVVLVAQTALPKNVGFRAEKGAAGIGIG